MSFGSTRSIQSYIWPHNMRSHTFLVLPLFMCNRLTEQWRNWCDYTCSTVFLRSGTKLSVKECCSMRNRVNFKEIEFEFPFSLEQKLKLTRLFKYHYWLYCIVMHWIFVDFNYLDLQWRHQTCYNVIISVLVTFCLTSFMISKSAIVNTFQQFDLTLSYDLFYDQQICYYQRFNVIAHCDTNMRVISVFG